MRRLLLATLVLGATLANAAPTSDKFNIRAQKYTTNLDTGITKADGDVKVWMSGKEFTASHVEYNPVAGTLKASENVAFKEATFKITGGSMDVNVNTGFGTYDNANMLYGEQFTVEAKELAYYAKDHFRAANAKISTCLDCPQAWSVTGSLIDIEIEGFAKIHHAMIMIKDVPVAYFPVFYVPIKSKRQSGFLIPQLMVGGELGTGFIAPYFWAISNNADTTFRYDFYKNAGNRIWNEFRYMRSNRTYLDVTSSFNLNTSKQKVRPENIENRYGVSIEQRAQLSPQFVQRFQSEFASDPRYTYQFGKDFSATRQPSLPTEASLVWQNDKYFAESQINLNQDNIERARSDDAKRADYGSINVLPYSSFTMPAMGLGLGIYTDLKAETLSLRRRGRGVAAESGLDGGSNQWIRTGDRFTGSASIYRPSSVSWLSVNPELNLRYDQYRLQGDMADRVDATYSSVSRSPNRFHWQFKQDVESTVYKVFDVDVGELKAIRHSFTPTLNWTYSPKEYRAKHPFFDDEGAPRFDIFDPNSDAAQDGSSDVLAERTLKPHNLLFFGFRTLLTGRFGTAERSYEEFLNLSAAQAYDVKDQKFEDLSVVLSATRYGFRVRSRANVEWALKKQTYRNEVSYSDSHFGVKAAQILTDVPEESGLSKFEEYQLGLDFKSIGPFSIGGWAAWDNILRVYKEQNYKVTYMSPSKCWFFTMGVSRKQQIGSGSFEYTPYLGIIFSESGENYLPF